MNFSEQIKIAYEATERGDKSFARQILEEVLSSDADIEPAWYLYAHIATNREDAVHSLKQVLELNPSHIRARQELDRLQQPHYSRWSLTQSKVSPFSPQDSAKSKPLSNTPKITSISTRSIILWGLGGLACFLLIFGSLFIFAKFGF
jgi:hypothetical protein